MSPKAILDSRQIANALSCEQSEPNIPRSGQVKGDSEADGLLLFGPGHCTFPWVRYALARWTALIAHMVNDQDGFLLNMTNLADRPDWPDALPRTWNCAQLTP